MSLRSSWFVYILECKDGSFYTGMTSHLERRLEEHLTHRGGHYTQSLRAVRLLWKEEHQDSVSARKREVQLKGWTRRKKIALIEGRLASLKEL